MTAQRQPHELILRARQGDRKSFGEVASIAEHLIRNAAQKKAWTQLRLAAEIAARAESPSKQLRRDERFSLIWFVRCLPEYRKKEHSMEYVWAVVTLCVLSVFSNTAFAQPCQFEANH